MDTSRAAAGVISLINSSPHTPSQAEIEAVIVKAMNTSPSLRLEELRACWIEAVTYLRNLSPQPTPTRRRHTTRLPKRWWRRREQSITAESAPQRI